MAFIHSVLSPPHTWTTGLLVAATTVALLLWRALSPLPISDGAPLKLSGWPIVGSLGCLISRSTLMERGKQASPDGNFSFHLESMTIVALSGRSARATYFASRSLDLSEGQAGKFE